MKQKNNPATTPELRYIYWFAYYHLDSPSVRYRAKYPLDYLKSHHHINSSLIIPGYHPKNIFLFITTYLSALFFRKPHSIIVIQRINSNFIYANLLKFLIKVHHSNTIYDLDDADFLQYPPSTIYYFIKNCSLVSVGSNELMNNLKILNKNMVLITSPTPDIQIIKQNRNKLLTIGWIGGFGGAHKESLMTLFFPSLINLPFKIKLVLLGVSNPDDYAHLIKHFNDFNNVSLEMPQQIDWKNEPIIQKTIATFDIGIATLLDTELQRSKSAFKLKQYLNNGVPVLSSDVPENNTFIEDGTNGFLCSTPEDFRKRIIEINEMNETDYNTLSANARKSIPKFTLPHYCETIITIHTSLPILKNDILDLQV